MEIQEYLLTSFDEKLVNVANLKWLPWIGKQYFKTSTVILGESQYEDGDEWQDNNVDATRTNISLRFSGSRGKLCTNVEKVLLDMNNPTLEQGNNIWKSVVYFNLVQRLLSSIKERPNDEDFDIGWHVFFRVVDIINPNICIVLGKSSCGRLGFHLNNNETGWRRNVSEFYQAEKIINLSKNEHKLKLIFINHPSGSRSFKYDYWSKLIKDNVPNSKWDWNI
jgi:hypothetical protein